jgi:hypothetical protein
VSFPAAPSPRRWRRNNRTPPERQTPCCWSDRSRRRGRVACRTARSNRVRSRCACGHRGAGRQAASLLPPLIEAATATDPEVAKAAKAAVAVCPAGGRHRHRGPAAASVRPDAPGAGTGWSTPRRRGCPGIVRWWRTTPMPTCAAPPSRRWAKPSPPPNWEPRRPAGQGTSRPPADVKPRWTPPAPVARQGWMGRLVARPPPAQLRPLCPVARAGHRGTTAPRRCVLSNVDTPRTRRSGAADWPDASAPPGGMDVVRSSR